MFSRIAVDLLVTTLSVAEGVTWPCAVVHWRYFSLFVVRLGGEVHIESRAPRGVPDGA